MSQIRTLPIRVAPIPGEALDSWLEALAARSYTTWADLLTSIGLIPAEGPRTNGWIAQLRPDEAAAVSHATGIEVSDLHAMTLARFDRAALRIRAATRTVDRTFPWGRGRGSRYCPDCLADSGGSWQLTWRLGWSFACLHHACLLADECPGCGKRQRLRPFSGEVVPRPGSCANPGDGVSGLSPTRCGADLTTAEVARFPADHPVLTAQQNIYDIIDSSTTEFGIYTTNPQPAITALADIRAVAGRILAYATAEDLSRILSSDLLAAHRNIPVSQLGQATARRPTPKPGLAAPAHAATAAVGVTAALTVIAAPDIATGGEALRWLVTKTRDGGRAVRASNIGWGQQISPTLSAVQLAALAPLFKPVDQLRHRTPMTIPRHPRPRATRIDHLVRRVPTMLWPTWSLRLAVPGTHQRILRPVASATLLLVGTRLHRADAVTLLNSPIAASTVSRVLQLMTNHGAQSILLALIRMADHLADNDITIDYQRRRLLDYTALLPDKTWRQICRATGTAGPFSSRARVARSFLFERISGLPSGDAPEALDDNEFRTKTADFPKHLTPELAAALHHHAAEFLADHHIYDEPVTWQPPTDLLDDLPLPSLDPAAVDIGELHRLIRREDHSPGAAANALGTTLDIIRHLLEERPAPTRPPTTADQARAHGHAYMTARNQLPRDVLIDLYQRQRISLRDIAERVGVSRPTLASLARDYEIPLREPHPHAKIHIDRDWLYDRYVNQRRTLSELARETGMSTANMARWAKRYDILMRPRGGPSHSANLDANTMAATAPLNLQPALTTIGGWERLRRFAAATRYPTLTAAAKGLGINQITLTSQVNRLERELGGPLLNRAERNHPMTLTPLGEEILAAINVAADQRP
ncbi:LysR family transcriptional regulator [Nocardia brasiliensis]|uniref:LysR family transcriptional regulator n=1 Tax=Nocardia brasiliensis TaxID=37326 RepID=A0A6G9Y178_NOCBR|nr:TniQ family protein [Nocardia brasiliensis]QIS06948.1 LysR family transcriptional regulator [Nocardia brasiliensis]